MTLRFEKRDVGRARRFVHAVIHHVEPIHGHAESSAVYEYGTWLIRLTSSSVCWCCQTFDINKLCQQASAIYVDDVTVTSPTYCTVFCPDVDRRWAILSGPHSDSPHRWSIFQITSGNNSKLRKPRYSIAVVSGNREDKWCHPDVYLFKLWLWHTRKRFKANTKYCVEHIRSDT